MKAQEAIQNDRAYGLVKVTNKHRETAWVMLHDDKGNLLMDGIIVEMVATLLAKSYKAEEL